MHPRLRLPRSSTSAALLVELAAECGLSPARSLRDTGIVPSRLTDPGAEIAEGQELTLVRNIVAELGDLPGIGLLAGSRYHVTTHGVWGFAVISSPTVRRAVEVGVRYADLAFSHSAVSVVTEDDLIAIRFDDRWVPPTLRPFLAERDVAATWTVQHDVLPVDLPLRRLRFTFPDPGAAAAHYTKLFGIRPEFGAPHHEIAFDAAILDLPLPQANPHTALVCELQCARLLQKRRARLGLAGRVRDTLLRTPNATADQDVVAAELAVSVRTMRRRLAEEGTSFRELVAETTGLLAEELLTAGLTVQEVAHRLGYAGAPSFSYAFKRWSGTSPGHYARTTRQRR